MSPSSVNNVQVAASLFEITVALFKFQKRSQFYKAWLRSVGH